MKNIIFALILLMPIPAFAGDLFNQPEEAILQLQSQVDELKVAIKAIHQAKPIAVNIDDLGAVAWAVDPEFDNGPIIQAAIDAACSSTYLPIFIPGQAYSVKTTIKLGSRQQAIRIMGTGRSQFTNDPRFTGSQSRLIWTGETGGTILRIESTGCCIDGIALHGGVYGSETRAGVGLMVAKGEGIGTGHLWIPQITVANCDTGIRFGSPEGPDHNCDQSRIQMLVVDRCEIGVHNAHCQAVSNSIGKAWVRNTDTAFFVEGGRFSVDSADVIPSVKTFVKIGNVDGALLHRFSNVQVDAPSGETVILDSLTWRPVQVVFDGLYYGGKPTGPVFKIRDCNTLIIRDSNWLRNGLIRCNGRGKFVPSVHISGGKFHNTHLPKNIIDHTQSVKPYVVSWVGCHDYYGMLHENGVEQ